jgi:hypothetical protein
MRSVGTVPRSVSLALAVLGLGGLLVSRVPAASASSHREAPLITEDPTVDNTDVYAFVDPVDKTKVDIIANWIPLEEPAGGPNFYRFSDDARYDINIDNNGDARDDIVFSFRFKTSVRNGNTFLYNVGPIGSLDDPNLNIVQSYRVTRIQNGVKATIGSGLLTAPANIGPRSTPNYEVLAAKAVYDLGKGVKVFAGPRAEVFYVDLGSVFDLLGLRPLNAAHAIPLPVEPGINDTSGFNVHTIALQVPTRQLVRGDDPVIGVYSTTLRRKVRVLGNPFDLDSSSSNGSAANLGPFVQVSRLGMPLVNELVIPLAMKDRFNASDPKDDAQFASFVLDPEPARLTPVLYPVFSCFPSAPRDDIAAIFLTGIPGLNQPQHVTPSEMIRLNTSIAPTPIGSRDRLGLLAGQGDGFPNGRRLEDDTVDIELRALAGATPLTDHDGVNCNVFPNNSLTDGVDAADVPLLDHFPYIPIPHQGYDHVHDHSNT